MKIINILDETCDILVEGLDINQDVFNDDRKNIKYEEQGTDSFYHFTRTIMGKTLDVYLEIYNQQRCHVQFTIDGLYVKEKHAKYDVMLALRVISYVVSCMRSIQNIHNTIEQFEFTADKEHEMQYDKLLPRLSSKLDFSFTKHPWEYQRSMRDKIEKTVKLTALYEIHLH